MTLTNAQSEALDAFASSVRTHYGAQLHSIVLFGSRARGDASLDSDADVAILLADGPWNFWDEKANLAGIAYDMLIEWGLHIQPWPIAKSAWDEPKRHQDPRFIERIKRDARAFREAA